MKTELTLEVYNRNSRKYRVMYRGRLSQIVKRLSSVYDRYRVKDADGNEVSV